MLEIAWNITNKHGSLHLYVASARHLLKIHADTVLSNHKWHD